MMLLLKRPGVGRVKFFFGVLAAQPGGVTQQEAAMRRLSHARGVGRCPRGESAAARAGGRFGLHGRILVSSGQNPELHFDHFPR